MISSQTLSAPVRKLPPTIYLYRDRVNGNIHIYDEQLKLYRYGNMTEQNALDQFRTDTHQQFTRLNIKRI